MSFSLNNGRSRPAMAEINITPLVDVVLVLLVIFMITAPVLQSGIEVAVPKTKTVREVSEQRITLSIDRYQQVYLGDKLINIHEVANRLRQKAGDDTDDLDHKIIYLRADERVPFGAFAALMDAVKQAGITNISIVTQPLEEKSASEK